MKICPKCRRTYDDSKDFCLRDGKPLARSEEEASAFEQAALEAAHQSAVHKDRPRVRTRSKAAPLDSSSSARVGSASNRGHLETAKGSPRPRPPPISTGTTAPIFKASGPPAPRSWGTAPGVGDTPDGGPDQGHRRNRIEPWVPGTVRESSVMGVRITVPVGMDSTIAPWDTAEPIPMRKVSVVPPEESSDSEPNEIEAVVLTPDLPVPPAEREEVEPVGDETVLVLETDEDEDDLDEGLELEEILPPPEPELPLVVRRTTEALLKRPTLLGPLVPPPVEDESERALPMLAIHTEDAFIPPEPGEDEDGDEPFLVFWHGQRVDARGHPIVSRRFGSVARLALVGILSVAVVAVVAGLIYWMLIGSQRDGGMGSPSADRAGVPGQRQLRPDVPTRDVMPVVSREATVTGLQADEASDNPLPTDSDRSSVEPGPNDDETTEPALSEADGEESGVEPQEPDEPEPVSRESVPGDEARPAETESDRPPSEDVRVAAAIPDEGSITVVSTPSGATVYLGSVKRGSTPVTLIVPLGRYPVKLVKEGYASAETSLTVDRQNSGTVSISLEPEEVPRTAPDAPEVLPSFRLIVLSSEVGAEVFVNGASEGPAPLSVTLTAGRHTVKVVPEGKPPQEAVIEVGANVAPDHVERKYFQF